LKDNILLAMDEPASIAAASWSQILYGLHIKTITDARRNERRTYSDDDLEFGPDCSWESWKAAPLCI